MRKLLIAAILGLFGLSAHGITHKKAAKLRGSPYGGDVVKDTNVNANANNDFIANVGLNGLGNIEKEDEKSASWSDNFSKERHHDSQKVDISISFNIGGDSDSDEESSDSGTSGMGTAGTLTKDINKVIDLSVGSIVNDATKGLGNAINVATQADDLAGIIAKKVTEALGNNGLSNIVSGIEIVPGK